MTKQEKINMLLTAYRETGRRAFYLRYLKLTAI